MFKKLSTLMALVVILGIVGFAQAQPAPYQSVATITAASLTTTWDAPAATYGPLLSLQTYRLAGGATLKVDHIIAVTSAISITNSIESAAAGATLLSYPEGYIAPQKYATNDVIFTTTPVKPVWIVPGDKLLFTVSATNMVPSYVVIRAGFPGK